MRCKDAHKMMTPWMDDELPREDEMNFQAHIDGCPSCSAEAEALRRIAGILDAAPPIRPGPGLHQKILTRFERETGARGLLERQPARDWGFPTVLAAGALTGLVFGCTLGAALSIYPPVVPADITEFLFYLGGLFL